MTNHKLQRKHTIGRNRTQNHKIIDKNMKIVNLEILKVKTWFGDKDLFL